MKVFFDHNNKFLFSMELDPSDTVLEMKQKIELTHRIPVSRQNLCFFGLIFRPNQDSHTLEQCYIFDQSRLQLTFHPDNLPDVYVNQLRKQTQQSQVPSTSINPGCPAMARSNDGQVFHQTEKSFVPSLSFIDELLGIQGNVNVQESPRRNYNNQDWLPMEPYSTSNTFGDFSFGFPAMARRNDGRVLHQTENSPLPPCDAFTGFLNPAMARSNDGQVLHQTEKLPLPPSDEVGAFLNPGWPEMARSNDDQVFHQTEKSFGLSYSSVEEFLGIQDSTSTDQGIRDDQSFRSVTTQGNVNVQQPSRRNDNSQDLLSEEPSSTSNTFGDFSFGEYLPLSTQGNVNVQESSRRNDNSQDLLPEEPSFTSSTFGDFSFGEDLPLSTELFTNIQSYGPPSTTQEFQMEQPSSLLSNTFGDFSFGEHLPLSTGLFTNTQTQEFQMEQPSLLSNSAEQRINDQDLPARAGSSNQVVQTEVINIPESPESSSNKRAKNLRIMVLPYSRENKPVWKFWVEVNASENVEELKIELAKIQQRSQLDLPEGGYFFIHNDRLVDEKQSFLWNGITQGALLQIFPGNFTEDNRTDT